MGMGEQAGKVAGGIVDALKQSPALLAILLINVLIVVALLFLVYQIAAATKVDREARNAMLAQCMQNLTK